MTLELTSVDERRHAHAMRAEGKGTVEAAGNACKVVGVRICMDGVGHIIWPCHVMCAGDTRVALCSFTRARCVCIYISYEDGGR